MPGYNLERLEKVANGLGDLLNKVIFIGGSVLELYATDPTAPEMRPSREIDCLLNIEGVGQYLHFARELEAKGFQSRQVEQEEQGLHHWRYGNINLTITYPDHSQVGYHNRWFREGIFHSVLQELPWGPKIRLFSPPYMIATKIEAFLHRGNQDFRLSEDFEDIVYLLDNRPEIKQEVFSAFHEIRSYIRSNFELFLGSGDLEEGLAYVLPFGSGTRRINKITQFMQEFVGLEPSYA